MPDDDAPRVAIPLNTTTPSIPLKKRSRPAHTKRHRAGHTFDESSSSSGSEAEPSTRPKVITSYSAGNSSDSEHEKRKSSSSRRNKRTSRSRSPQPQRAVEEEKEDKPPVKWGLTINMKGKKKEDGRREGDLERSKPRALDDDDRGSKHDGRSRNGKRERDLDDKAMDALLGAEPPKKSKYDPADPNREPQAEDYKAIPIDDFGATLLRGFGWDGKMRGKVKEVVKHANLTGLGAKDAKEAEDLGAWNQKTTKDSRPVRLEDYRREESKKRERREHREKDSYKREREREHREHHRR